MNRKLIFDGICLNGGRSKLTISRAKTFAITVHNNRSSLSIPLILRNLSVKGHTITIRGRKEIRVVEHLFSALYGLNIFNIKIDLYGDELPFFDGSSKNFVEKLADWEVKGADFLVVDKKISVRKDDSYILFEPCNNYELFIDMELSHPFIKKQSIRLAITKDNYIKEIAPARTFVFTDESDPRIKNLPPYGIGITSKGTYSAEPLRFSDEPVRHKILDLLGDLYVLKKRLVGKIKAKNTSHNLNLSFVKTIYSKISF